MAVPAGDIRRVEARERFRLDDDVFEDLVNRVPNVQLTIRVGGSIMQDEGRLTLARFTHLLVKTHLLPLLEPLRLPLGEIRFHWKTRLRQVQGVLIIAHRMSEFSHY